MIMLTILKGDDEGLIAQFIKNTKTKLAGYEVITSSNVITMVALQDLIQANSLFASKRLILFTPEKVGQIDFDDGFLLSVSKNKDLEFIINVTKLKQTKDLLKPFLDIKDIKVIEYSKQRTFNVFKLADEIVIYQNKVSAIKLLDQLTEDEIFSVVTTISYNLRCLISIKFNNQFAKTLKPFVVKKFSACKLNDDQIKAIYKDLLDLDVKSKSESTGLKNLIIDFILRM